MDKTEIADLIAGREEDIAEWERRNEEDWRLVESLPKGIAIREDWIADTRARIAELKLRLEADQWLTQ